MTNIQHRKKYVTTFITNDGETFSSKTAAEIHANKIKALKLEQTAKYSVRRVEYIDSFDVNVYITVPISA